MPGVACEYNSNQWVPIYEQTKTAQIQKNIQRNSWEYVQDTLDLIDLPTATDFDDNEWARLRRDMTRSNCLTSQ